MELAGRALEVLRRELDAARVRALAELEQGQRTARIEGMMLWAHRRRGGDGAEAAEHLEAAILERGTGDWPADYLGAGAGGYLALARGLGAGQAETARGLVLRALALCDEREYRGMTESGQSAAPGARCLGEWARLLGVCSQLLVGADDRELRIAAARAVAAVLNFHYHPEQGLLVEVVGRDFFRFDDHRGTFVHSGAALMALGAVLEEAGRTSEERLFSLAAAYLRRHIEEAWGAGGVREALVDGKWSDEVRADTQAEALAALATLVAYRAGAWEVEWFGRIYETVGEGIEAVDTLRMAVHCCECLDRISERDGRPQGWLALV